MDPFAPIPSAGPSQDHAPCPRCGNPMDPALAGYDSAGQLVCRSCNSMNAVVQANRTIEEKDPTSTRNLWLGAAGSVLLGMSTCLMSGFGRFFFLLAPVAIFTGGWTFVHLLRHPETRSQLGGGWWVVLFMSLIGVLFGLLACAVGLLSIAAQGMLAR